MGTDVLGEGPAEKAEASIVAHDQSTAPEAAEETPPAAPSLRWRVEQSDPDNPFTAHLLFTEDDEPLLWWPLDPLSLNEVIEALVAVKDAQLATLSGNPAASSAPYVLPDSVEHGNGMPHSPDEWGPTVSQRSWFARHKVVTVLLAVLVLIFFAGFVTGGARV